MLRYRKRPAASLSRIACDQAEENVVYTAGFNPMLGTDRVVSVIIEPAVIDKILEHLKKNGRGPNPPGGEAAA